MGCLLLYEVISESFQLTMQSTSDSPDHIAGYLLKKSKHGEWQKRYFETNSTFLTYYKSKKMTKLLAALSMASVGDISLVGHYVTQLNSAFGVLSIIALHFLPLPGGYNI